MAKLSHLLITLPLIVAPVFTLGLRPAAAETVTPIDALELIAKASAIDAKCKTLPQSQHDELNGYLAKAEIATTARYSVGEAKDAVALGRKSGEVESCGPAAIDDVQATLGAAREAMEAVQSRSSSSRTRKVASLEPQRQVAQPTMPVIQGPGGLKLYGSRAMAYYVERRCRHLSPGETKDFWQRIVASYRSAVSAYGADAVSKVQSRAETDAGAWDCGQRSASLVETAYSQSRRF